MIPFPYQPNEVFTWFTGITSGFQTVNTTKGSSKHPVNVPFCGREKIQKSNPTILAIVQSGHFFIVTFSLAVYLKELLSPSYGCV